MSSLQLLLCVMNRGGSELHIIDTSKTRILYIISRDEEDFADCLKVRDKNRQIFCDSGSW